MARGAGSSKDGQNPFDSWGAAKDVRSGTSGSFPERRTPPENDRAAVGVPHISLMPGLR